MARKSVKNVGRLIDSIKQSAPVEQMFLADLCRSIEIDADKEQGQPSKYYHPSSMNCIRNMYYARVGCEVELGGASYSGVGIVNSGSDIHVRLQQAIEGMKENGIDCTYMDVETFIKKRKLKGLKVIAKQGMETKLFHKSLAMRFLTDGIIKYNGKYYILEIKTETASKFWHREDVDKYHYNQATAYSIAFGLDDVIFVYVSRDTLQMKSFMLNVTDEMREDLIGKIEECEYYVKKFKTPPKPEDVAKRSCGYCSYFNICKRDR